MYRESSIERHRIQIKIGQERNLISWLTIIIAIILFKHAVIDNVLYSFSESTKLYYCNYDRSVMK